MCVFLSTKNQFTMKLLLFHLRLEKKTKNVMNIVVPLDLMLTLRLLNRVLSPFLHRVETAIFKTPFNNVTAEPCK